MASPRAVIFDVDGVLVNSYRAHFQSFRAMLKELGTEFTESQFRAAFGRTTRDIIAKLHGDTLTDEEIRRFDDRKEALFREIVRQDFQLYERPNLHLAIEELVHKNGRQSPIGVVERDYEVSLARLVNGASANDFSQGPVEYVDVDLGPNEQLACVKTGVYLFNDDDKASLALLVAAIAYHLFCKFTPPSALAASVGGNN